MIRLVRIQTLKSKQVRSVRWWCVTHEHELVSISGVDYADAILFGTAFAPHRDERVLVATSGAHSADESSFVCARTPRIVLHSQTLRLDA